MTVPYWNTQQGLYMHGAGMQKSIIYNQIENPTETVPGAAAIRIVRNPKDRRTFQQTGTIRDLQITSDDMIDGSIGIDMEATWAYTIQRIRIMKMGSHGIKIRNRYWENGMSDMDASENVHLDHIVSEENGGWGLIVDAGNYGVSTGFIHMERCKIRGNKGGGIQWTGQMGVIERCGIYGNGVTPGSISPSGTIQPKPREGTYGILVKNVKATSNGLLITGCEIQGNADVQVMVAVGGNIKIVQNEFKDDDIGTVDRPGWTFPSIDIQVGDGNMTDGATPTSSRTVNACVIEDNRIRASYGMGWGKFFPNIPPHTVVKVNTNAVGTVIGKWWSSGYAVGGNWKLVDLVEKDPYTNERATVFRDGHIHLNTHIHRDGADGGHVLLPFASTQIEIHKDETRKVDTSQWSKYRFRILGGTSFSLANPTARSVGSPLFLEFVNGTTSNVKVNFGDNYDIVGKSVIIPEGKTVTGILLLDETGRWIPFSPWTCEGRPLLSSLTKT